MVYGAEANENILLKLLYARILNYSKNEPCPFKIGALYCHN
jgi:hypothetical protein